MRKNIFIGLDGGGTKTKLIIEDEHGKVLGRGRGGPAQIRLSPSQAWSSIFHALDEALKEAKLSINDPGYFFHVGMGLAGTELPNACRAFLEKPHPFKTIDLRSDAYTACLGAHNGKDGDIIIIGTGVIGYQVFEGFESQVNGWGFPHGDEGGGAWLGMQAVRHTLKWQDGRGEKSSMLGAIFKQFDLDLTKMIIWANQAKSTQFAELAPIVLQYLEQKDPISTQLIERAALEINQVGAALEKINKTSLPCSLFGGVSSFIEPYLEQTLKQRIVPRKYDATQGAVIMIRQKVQEL